MEAILYDETLEGDIERLGSEIQQQGDILHNRLLSPSSTNTSILIIACKIGRTDFVRSLLFLNPSLSEEIDPNDKSSLLHLAARNNHQQLVQYLLSVNPGLCFARDRAGRNPVHVAAMKGWLRVTELLLSVSPAAARERVGLFPGGNSSGDTILHLCVKFGKFDVLQEAVRVVGDAEMLNATDVDGNTILHLAVATPHKEMKVDHQGNILPATVSTYREQGNNQRQPPILQVKIIKFLLGLERLKKHSLNSNGLTALDVFKGIPQIDRRVREELQRALDGRVLRSKELRNNKHPAAEWIEKQRGALMIVASLIATMAFQVGLNPPGGVWQDTNPSPISSTPATTTALWHFAGTSILAQQNPYVYSWFFAFNTFGFLFSIGSIFFLISGLPLKRCFIYVIMVAMWGALMSMGITYAFSTANLIPRSAFNTRENLVVACFTIGLAIVIAGLLVGHFFTTISRISWIVTAC